MDTFLYESSQMSQREVEPMLDKEMLYVLDQNGGSYNGQISIDTSTLSNSGRWLAYSESYLEIPFIVALTATTEINAEVNGYMLGLKNGYHQIIDSIQVDYNNTNVVQLQPFLNFYVSYKLNTTLSPSDAQLWGAQIGFALDSPGSYIYSAAVSANGQGNSNNRVNYMSTPTYTAVSSLEKYNAGYLKRLQNTAYQVGTAQANGFGNLATLSSANVGTLAKNFFGDSGGADDATRVHYVAITAIIRMKDLSDFFAKMPLLRGSYIRMTINYNSCSQAIAVVGAGPTLGQAAPTMLSGRTNPMMLSSSAANEPSNAAVAVGNNTWTVRCGVKSVSMGAITVSHPISSCRLYVPGYTLNPDFEEQYLSLHPTKTIVYNDIYNFNISAVAAGSSFNSILSNGIVNPQQVVVIPLFNSGAANMGFALSPYLSIWDTAPGTTSPLAALSNFNVSISGQNIFQQNEAYDFEAFCNELASANSINGGSSVGLSSGLIGAYEFSTAYRYYVADLSRRLPAEDKVPKSITVSGTNVGAQILDLFCFVVYQRSLTVSLVTGEVLRQ